MLIADQRGMRMSLEPDMEVDGEDAPGAGGAGGEAPENEMQALKRIIIREG